MHGELARDERLVLSRSLPRELAGWGGQIGTGIGGCQGVSVAARITGRFISGSRRSHSWPKGRVGNECLIVAEPQ